MVAEEEHIEMVEGETNYPVRLCSIDTVPAFSPILPRDVFLQV